VSLAPEQVWDDFLQRWPLEALPSLTLPQYSTAGDSDSFSYWLEAKTENLGSIWGGSAFKFGIFSRKDKTVKESGGGSTYSSTMHGTASTATPQKRHSRGSSRLFLLLQLLQGVEILLLWNRLIWVTQPNGS